ncbi:S-adenosyl-L-methionine-dependent methyltransferase [Lentithecium fluviatile CBS 122367]|uniref:S-adenosyl-L-methionine-dependent methyltransferase n=1 Tax=Lentithecium fluviatile CBS 122367 TaxID=1168545 RepID=A0A6G1IF59_9PLEO|nr:S-adenosyl-L-methionine-dependent methyltransferase [Lentithecium fluviatile CBS 122367]
MAGETAGRLIGHFQNIAEEQHGTGWSELWDNGESDLWDRGIPSPALTDIVAERRDLLSPVNANGGRKKAFVPGCGKGYDAIMLALHGFDAWGLEISETAVSTAERYASKQMQSPSPENFARVEVGSSIEPGSVRFIKGDFFKQDWEVKLLGEAVKFDLIYDYTFLCALHPNMRCLWAKRMAELLKPGGLLICLEFPLWKDLKSPGPPWGLKGIYWDLLARGGDGLIEDGQEERPLPAMEHVQFVCELNLKPARSFKQGRGEDMLSVWRRL